MASNVTIVKNTIHGCIRFSEGAKNAIIYSIKADPKKIFSFNISEKSLNEFEIISRLYLNEKLEREYTVSKL